MTHQAWAARPRSRLCLPGSETGSIAGEAHLTISRYVGLVQAPLAPTRPGRREPPGTAFDTTCGSRWRDVAPSRLPPQPGPEDDGAAHRPTRTVPDWRWTDVMHL